MPMEIDCHGHMTIPSKLEQHDANYLTRASDHPQARYQKRQQEEKGAFGKSSRRLGSSRATRTQTPAKKENTTIDGFAAALKYDQQCREADGRNITSSSQSSTDATGQPLSSNAKEPQQILIYGFVSDFQWQAIAFYERVSGGMICEDYPRDPPAEKRKYSSGTTRTGASSIRRTLTQTEHILASQYHGGESWIVVTFDSREAADRAIAASPHVISGYWAFAERWQGLGPAKDKSIPGTEDAERSRSATMGTGDVSKKQDRKRTPITFPRQHKASEWEEATGSLTADDATETSTVTSATATAVEESGSQLRSRSTYDIEPTRAEESSIITPRLSKTHFTHFPNTPRTALKPVTEALLPQPSWWEGALKSLATSGWIPGDMIGSSVPRKEDGSFDLDAASIYWRFWYWIDGVMGTDLCGLKDES